MSEGKTSSDVFSILLASDIHLGCHEKDKIRGSDSFNTFEEILEIAQSNDVDFVLLGGDLFHENKPSPLSMYKCLSLLRKYCMGDKPISVEFLSNPREIFYHCANQNVNYEDPNMNISMPVYSIHGNHDDPAGVSLLSALDILSVSGLVNYFGKWTNLTEVIVKPIVLRKGESKLAIYGLSHIKDSRLARLFRDGKVQFEQYDSEDCMHIGVLHQNRADRGPDNFIQESYLPDFLDLVIWGHEHECRIDMEFNAEKDFYVTQPGSPVATSLCDGEAVEKHVAILKIWKKKMKMEKIKLQTVRPFIFKNVSLSKSNIGTVALHQVAGKVHSFLTGVIEDMLDSAKAQLTGHQMQPALPLLRLRVEYSRQEEFFNQIRFGQKFSESVANPLDMVLLRRSTTGKRAKKGDYLDGEAMDLAVETFQAGDSIDQSLGTVLEQYFAEADESKQLAVLSVKGLGEVVNRFIHSGDKECLEGLVTHQMKKCIDHLKGLEIVDKTTIDQHLATFRNLRISPQDELKEVKDVLERTVQNVTSEFADNQMASDGEGTVDFTVSPKASRGRGRGRGRGASRGRGKEARAARGSRSGGGSSRRPDLEDTQPSRVPSSLSHSKRGQLSVADMFKFDDTPPKRAKIVFEDDSE